MAERKIKNLVEVGAVVHVIAPALTAVLQEMANSHLINWVAREWQKGDLDHFSDVLMVFAATNNPEVNQQVSLEAREAHKLINRADNPADCDFIIPATVRSGEITLTVSTSNFSQSHSEETTGSANPALTALLRQKLSETVGPEFTELSVLLRELRPIVKKTVSPEKRPQLWRQMVNSPVLELLRTGDKAQAKAILQTLLSSAQD